MSKSKIAIFSNSDTPIDLQDVPIPALQPGEILVKNECTTLCRSDLYTFCGKRKEKTPTILGHEIVGRIAAMASDSVQQDLRGNTLEIGTRITWGIYASDPESTLAKAGIPQKGPDLFKYGHEQITETSNLHGGLSQYTILRPNTPIIAVSEKVPVSIAAIINCAIATVAGAMRLAGPVTDKKLLVSGSGMLGMIACAMGKTKGAAQIIAVDTKPDRLIMAQQFGANHGILASEAPTKVQALFDSKAPIDTVIELSGVASAMQQTLQLLSIGGTVVWVGATYPQPDLHINAEQVVRNLWTIKGLHNYNRDDLMTAVSFLEQHYQDFPFSDMIHDDFTLPEVNEAFEYALDKNPFRVGVKIS